MNHICGSPRSTWTYNAQTVQVAGYSKEPSNPPTTSPICRVYFQVVCAIGKRRPSSPGTEFTFGTPTARSLTHAAARKVWTE